MNTFCHSDGKKEKLKSKKGRAPTEKEMKDEYLSKEELDEVNDNCKARLDILLNHFRGDFLFCDVEYFRKQAALTSHSNQGNAKEHRLRNLI